MESWCSMVQTPVGFIAAASRCCSPPRTSARFHDGNRSWPLQLSQPGNQAATRQPSTDDHQVGIKHQGRLHPIFFGCDPGEQSTQQSQQQRHAEEHEISHPSLCRRIDWAVSNSKGWEQLPQSEDDIN